jgi:hypothetical protein
MARRYRTGRTQPDPRDAYHYLACAVLHRAVLDSRQASLAQWIQVDARQFLMGPDGEWYMRLLDLDAGGVREALVLQWLGAEAHLVKEMS